MRRSLRALLGLAALSVLGALLGHSLFRLQVKAQEQTAPPTATLGFEDTHYLVDKDGVIVNLKRRVKTWYFDGDRLTSSWKRGDLDFRVVSERPDEAGLSQRTVVASGDNFPTRKSTFAARGGKSSRAELRPSVCGLRGAPQREILGFTSYQQKRSLPANELGTVTIELWIAPTLNCMPLQARVWRETPDGREFTLNTLEPLFRREGVPEGVFAIPEQGSEMPPSELEGAVLERITPGGLAGEQFRPGASFERLDQRYHEDQIALGENVE